MKIAVASSNGFDIAQHFGRSSYFVIFDVADGKIAGKEERRNTFTAHAKGVCAGEDHHGHGCHSHVRIVEALSDCTAVLCRGIGWPAVEALVRAGIKPCVLHEDCAPEQAAAMFLSGNLAGEAQDFCRGHC